MATGKKCVNPEHTERYSNGRCVECMRASRRKHYYENKEQYYDRNKVSRAKMRAYLTALKESTPCADCGINYPSFVMDFHHLEAADKEAEIGALISNGTWAKLLAEVDKCVILCANCHRIRTWTSG